MPAQEGICLHAPAPSPAAAGRCSLDDARLMLVAGSFSQFCFSLSHRQALCTCTSELCLVMTVGLAGEGVSCPPIRQQTSVLYLFRILVMSFLLFSRVRQLFLLPHLRGRQPWFRTSFFAFHSFFIS